MLPLNLVKIVLDKSIKYDVENLQINENEIATKITLNKDTKELKDFVTENLSDFNFNGNNDLHDHIYKCINIDELKSSKDRVFILLPAFEDAIPIIYSNRGDVSLCILKDGESYLNIGQFGNITVQLYPQFDEDTEFPVFNVYMEYVGNRHNVVVNSYTTPELPTPITLYTKEVRDPSLALLEANTFITKFRISQFRNIKESGEYLILDDESLAVGKIISINDGKVTIDSHAKDKTDLRVEYTFEEIIEDEDIVLSDKLEKLLVYYIGEDVALDMDDFKYINVTDGNKSILEMLYNTLHLLYNNPDELDKMDIDFLKSIISGDIHITTDGYSILLINTDEDKKNRYLYNDYIASNIENLLSANEAMNDLDEMITEEDSEEDKE